MPATQAKLISQPLQPSPIILAAVATKQKHLHNRNLQIVKRYFYWYDLKRYRRDDVLKLLQDKEFFLDTRTISGIIFENFEFYKKIKLQKPSERDLQHYQWN